ncbi:MAG: 4,5-DOPA dioxygenase extradiol [Atopobiaceae bacterium]|nr:4,5-DOPA dioxygenase extradiol [Atopobiaceae bacterium]
MTTRMPALFAGHGSPLNAIEENRFSRGWEEVGRRLPKPRAILAVSAHWYTHGLLTNDEAHPKQVYDMYGFPQALYDLAYPVPGDPALAHELVERLDGEACVDNSWGIDHGTWSVLHRMFPEADVPVVQLSVDGDREPAAHLELGQRLAFLRDEGVMVFGSGNVVHNLGMVDWSSDNGAEWNKHFDAGVRAAIERRDLDLVADWGRLAGAELAVPTPEHFLPLLFVLGATSGDDAMETFSDGYTLGSMAMTGYLFGRARA